MTVNRGRSTTSVTVVVVTYNSERLLPDFFSSLKTALGGVTSAVVVSDNASSDGTVAVAEECWPEAIIVTSPTNRGYAAGINVAVDAVPTADAVLIVNDDIRMGEESVALLLEAVMEQEVGIAVPRLVDGHGELLKSLRREPTILRALGEAFLGGRRSGRFAAIGEVVQDPSAYDKPTTASWASGCAWLIGRDCWETVGEWDESLFLYAEDTEYALRAGDAGFPIQLVPDAAAVHLVGPSHENAHLWAMSVWNRYRVFRRRQGRLKGALFWFALLLNEGVRCIVGRRVHCAGASALLFRSKRPIEVR